MKSGKEKNCTQPRVVSSGLRGESYRDRGRAVVPPPCVSCTSTIAARQAVLNLSQQDLNWGPSL